MNLQGLLNSRGGMSLALLLARSLPPALGYPLARRLASWVAAHPDWEQVRCARVNQWVVSGEQLSGADLDRAVREVFTSAGRSIYDLYHTLQNPQAMKDMIDFTPSALELIEQSQSGKVSRVIAGVHTSNFDLALQASFLCGLRSLAITIADMPGSYQWQFEIRRRLGLEIVPASLNALKEGAHRLQSGRMVLTGLDRPLAEVKHRPVFFGRPSHVPVHHIHLALHGSAPVVVAATHQAANGRYTFDVSAPIAMKRDRDRSAEILRNAEAVLEVAEEFIRRQPQEWAMFLPVWPDVAVPM